MLLTYALIYISTSTVSFIRENLVQQPWKAGYIQVKKSTKLLVLARLKFSVTWNENYLRF
jgi:hypothetical protein